MRSEFSDCLPLNMREIFEDTDTAKLPRGHEAPPFFLAYVASSEVAKFKFNPHGEGYR